MRRRTQAEMDQLVEAAGFRKLEQRIDEWGIFTVSLAERIGAVSADAAIWPTRPPAMRPAVAPRARCGSRFSRRSSTLTYGAANWLASLRASMSPRSCLPGSTRFRSSAGRSFPIGRSTPSTACRCSSARLEGRTGHAWAPPAHRADHRGVVLHSFPAALHVRAARDRRPLRISVRRA